MYRATPLPWCGLSPAELLMGCRIRTDAPQHPKMFKPQWPYLDEFREKEEKYKETQEKNYDECHRSRNLPDSPNDTPVWVNMPQNDQVPGNVVSAAPEPRSYIVSVPSGQVRCNRSHL